MVSAWMVRAGRGGRRVGEFEEHSIVAVGFGGTVDLTGVTTRDELRARLEAEHVSVGTNALGNAARFALDIQQGDHVVTYDSASREYLVGRVRGGVRTAPALVEGLAKVRDVSWEGRVPRDALSQVARNSLGSLLTVFSIGDDVWAEFESVRRGERPTTDVTGPRQDEESDEDSRLLVAEAEEQAAEFIKDRVLRLEWDEVEELVAGLLRAMGYRAAVTARGPDRGRDILASPDGLGLQQPRIRVEVKHRQASMRAPDVRAFIGALRQSDNGLYVSTGGFSREAHYEAERAMVPVTLVDLDALVELLLDRYEDLDTASKALVPLRRIYWPAG